MNAEIDCQDTSYTDLIGVACPQCAAVFPADHAANCSIIWPFSGGRLFTEEPAVGGIDYGPCALCGRQVVLALPARPWFSNDPDAVDGIGKPLHDACQASWENISIRVKPMADVPKKIGEPLLPHHPTPVSKPPVVTDAAHLDAYGQPTSGRQQETEGLRALQAKAKIAKALGEATQEFAFVSPDQATFDDFARALGLLQQVALNGKDAQRDKPFFSETRSVAMPVPVVGPKVFVGRPYCGEVDDGPAVSVYSYPMLHPDSVLQITLERQHSSALCYGFNKCWSGMFSHAKFPFDWFVLHHQDIEPEGPWIDILIEEALKGGYDVMTALSPLKDDRGLTSTAYGSMEHDWDRVRRITLIEKDTMLPQTFGIEELVKVLGTEGIRGTPCFLNNTGVMAIRLKEKRLQISRSADCRVGPFAIGLKDDRRGVWPWCFPGFRMHDRIDFSPGYCAAEFISEDWDMGRWCARHGLKVGATSRIDLGHYGRSCYRNRWDKGQTHDEAFMQHARKQKSSGITS